MGNVKTPPTAEDWHERAEELGVAKGYARALLKLMHEGWEEPTARHLALALAVNAKRRKEGKV